MLVVIGPIMGATEPARSACTSLDHAATPVPHGPRHLRSSAHRTGRAPGRFLAQEKWPQMCLRFSTEVHSQVCPEDCLQKWARVLPGMCHDLQAELSTEVGPQVATVRCTIGPGFREEVPRLPRNEPSFETRTSGGTSGATSGGTYAATSGSSSASIVGPRSAQHIWVEI